MILNNFVYHFGCIILFHITYIWTYQCHQCNTKVYDYHVTIDNLPLPTEDDCNVIPTNHSCYVHVDWYGDGTSEVYYRIDPTLPYDTIIAVTERQTTLNTGEYTTRRSVGYSCRPNRTACNTIDDLKRVILSITFPTDEQIQKFDTLIAPNKDFNASSCVVTPSLGNCLRLNSTHCRRCTSTALYSKFIDICATCPAKRIIRNYFAYDTAFLINTGSHVEKIRIGCQASNGCNSLENIDKIKEMLSPKLNLKKFYRSTASKNELMILYLFTIILIKLF